MIQMYLRRLEDTESDLALIYRAIAHPRLWPSIAESWQRVEEYVASAGLEWIQDFIGVFEVGSNRFYGLYRLDYVTSSIRKMHTVLLPEAWGQVAKDARGALVEYVLDTYESCHTLITDIPATNRLAIKYALGGGMKQIGLIEGAWNESVDMLIFSRRIRKCQ